MRRIVRAAYLGEKLGDTSALENPAIAGSNQARSEVTRTIVSARAWRQTRLSASRSRRKAHATGAVLSGRFVFTLMTLELGLVPLPLYARNR